MYIYIYNYIYVYIYIFNLHNIDICFIYTYTPFPGPPLKGSHPNLQRLTKKGTKSLLPIFVEHDRWGIPVERRNPSTGCTLPETNSKHSGLFSLILYVKTAQLIPISLKPLKNNNPVALKTWYISYVYQACIIHPWKMMVGILNSFPFGFRPIFRGCLVC